MGNMPTINNHDILDSWSLGGNSIGASVPSKYRGDDNYCSDLFGRRGPQNGIAEEHDYAAAPRFVSANSYYGYHPIVTSGSSPECPMDTCENSIPYGATATGILPTPTRKRNLDVDHQMNEHAGKRARPDESPDNVDAVIKNEKESAEKMQQLRLVEDYAMTALESLLKHTHGCDFYNYALSDL